MACLASCGCASRAAGRAEPRGAFQLSPKTQLLIWAPTPTRNSCIVHPMAPRRQLEVLRRQWRETKKQGQLLVDGDRVPFLSPLATWDVLKGWVVLPESCHLPLESWLHFARKWSGYYVLPFDKPFRLLQEEGCWVPQSDQGEWSPTLSAAVGTTARDRRSPNSGGTQNLSCTPRVMWICEMSHMSPFARVHTYEEFSKWKALSA